VNRRSSNSEAVSFLPSSNETPDKAIIASCSKIELSDRGLRALYSRDERVPYRILVPPKKPDRCSAMAGLRPLLRKILWIAAIATLGAMVIQNPELWVFLHVYGSPDIWDVWPIWLLQVVVYWPVGYLVAGAIARHGHSKMASI